LKEKLRSILKKKNKKIVKLAVKHAKEMEKSQADVKRNREKIEVIELRILEFDD